MSKRGGKRGQVTSLADFNKEHFTKGGELDWAVDVHQEEEAPTQPTEIKQREKKDFSFKAGAITENFRDTAMVKSEKWVDPNMVGPFMAHVANVPHGLAQEDLEAVFPDKIDLKMVRTDKATFAYVEFADVDALHRAVIMDGTILKGRKLKIDVANDAQRAKAPREHGGKGGSSGRGGGGAANLDKFAGRNEMGQSQPSRGGGGSAAPGGSSGAPFRGEFSRDTMGVDSQPNAPSGGGLVGRGSAAPAMPIGSLSRDIFGVAPPVPDAQVGGRRGAPAATTPTSNGAGATFEDWRSQPAEAQPTTSPGGRGGSRSGGGSSEASPAAAGEGRAGSWKPGGGRGARGAAPPAPAAPPAAMGGGMGSWRDEEPTPQPIARAGADAENRRGAPADDKRAPAADEKRAEVLRKPLPKPAAAEPASWRDTAPATVPAPAAERPKSSPGTVKPTAVLKKPAT